MTVGAVAGWAGERLGVTDPEMIQIRRLDASERTKYVPNDECDADPRSGALGSHTFPGLVELTVPCGTLNLGFH